MRSWTGKDSNLQATASQVPRGFVALPEARRRLPERACAVRSDYGVWLRLPFRHPSTGNHITMSA